MSIKHEGLCEWIPALRAKGYERVVIIVVIREPVATVSSMVKRGHCKDANEARSKRSRLLSLAIADAESHQADLEFVTYEGLTEDALREWLPTIGLPYVAGDLSLDGQEQRSGIENLNSSHYKEVVQ